MNEQVMLRGLLLCVAAFCFSAASAGDTSDTGILVVAQDRGYMGNEETRAAFASVDAENKALIFITDKDSRKYLDAAVENFDADGTERLAVLPYFLSASHPGWQMAENWLRDDVCKQFSCAFSKPFGRSYYAIDVLDQALAKMSGPADKHLVVLGSGADSDAAVERMAQEWQHLAMSTDAAGRFAGVSTFVWNSDSDDTQAERLKSLADDENTVIAGYNFGWKFDSMMSLGAMLEHRVARDIAGDVMVIDVPAQTGGMWMQREANRNVLRGTEDIGVVIHAHGATFHWNERMRQAVVPLHEKYAVEYAFSMADRPTIETALKRLEARGMRAAVIVRVFGREDSFRSTIEKLLGMDLENREPGSHAHHGGHTGHGGHMMMGGGPIHTPLLVTSTGGLGDHPLFAEGLLARAREVSTDPASETVILVAHGVGNDDVNDYWLTLLDNLAAQIRVLGGDEFRAIEVATWREDWPDKRDEWVERVRAMVETAQADGGRALVVPARTNSGGPEDEFLEGLEYALADGFAPHPLFTRWVDAQIRDGMAILTDRETAAVAHREHSDY